MIRESKLIKKNSRLYNLNIDYIKENLKLNRFMNPNANDFHNEFVKQFNIEPNEKLLKTKNINFKLLDFEIYKVIYKIVLLHYNIF